jgi:hypothetical protein
MKKQHTYLFKIVSVPSEEPLLSRGLDKDFLEKLEALESNHELDGLHKGAAAKIKALLRVNVGILLKDPELPDSIKGLCVNRLLFMAGILKKMHSRSSESLLLSKQNKAFFPLYKEVALDLKKALIKARDPVGITFVGRNEKLFKWCRQELTETRNPLVEWLLGKVPDQLHKDDFLKQFDKLSDILNSLILVVGACDDLADTIQDMALTKIVVKIIEVETSEKIAQQAELFGDVKAHRDGIFDDYFRLVVDIWNDSIDQLESAFGKTYFDERVKEEFLNIFISIGESLTYSVLLNVTPHHKKITPAIIHEKLAPNIMVCCFRYLEKSLVVKLAAELDIEAPSESDLGVLQRVIDMSQVSAASSNAAATVSRELREGDLSTPFPFIINDRLIEGLLKGQSFVQKFEAYILGKGYTNGFFKTYSDKDPSEGYDYLSLLMLRRAILTRALAELDAHNLARIKNGQEALPDSDWTMEALAAEAIKSANSSGSEHLSADMLEKYKTHIDLIDSFSDSVALETDVYDDFFKQWEKDIVIMRKSADTIDDEDLKEQAGLYIDSWQDFLCMYLLYKRAFDGTI